jgi:hypothetical protein
MGCPAMRQFLITNTLALAVAFAALAQNSVTPDLSGVWVFNPAKSTLGKDNTIKAQTIAIDYKKSTIIGRWTI